VKKKQNHPWHKPLYPDKAAKAKAAEKPVKKK